MTKILFLSLLYISFLGNVYAERIQGQIQEIDFGASGQEHLIKLTNGRVIFVKPESELLAEKDNYQNAFVELEVGNKNELISISSLPDESRPEEDSPEKEMSYIDQTDLPSLSAATRIFNGMNRSYYSDTECTDRAQIWAYEEFRKNQLISRKVFLFFTNTYIRAYRYHWWFHVSPYVLVQGAEKIMDRRYTGGPRNVKTWTDIFIRSKKTCPVNTYRYYRNNKNGPEHCVLVKADMYYRLPYHVRQLEDYRRVKTQFSQSEINFSYRAFKTRGI